MTSTGRPHSSSKVAPPRLKLCPEYSTGLNLSFARHWFCLRWKKLVERGNQPQGPRYENKGARGGVLHWRRERTSVWARHKGELGLRGRGTCCTRCLYCMVFDQRTVNDTPSTENKVSLRHKWLLGSNDAMLLTSRLDLRKRRRKPQGSTPRKLHRVKMTDQQAQKSVVRWLALWAISVFEKPNKTFLCL